MLKHCNRRRCFSDSDGKTILDEVPPSLNRWRSDGAQSCSCGSGPATCWTLVELSTHDATFVGVKPSRLSTIFVGLKKKMIFLCFVLCCHDRLYCLKKWDKMEHICFETNKSNVHVPNPRNCNYEHVTEVISVSACVCVCVCVCIRVELPAIKLLNRLEFEKSGISGRHFSRAKSTASARTGWK